MIAQAGRAARPASSGCRVSGADRPAYTSLIARDPSLPA